MDESTTAFLLVETLAEQNMSEDQILRAMESLQKKTRDAQSHKAQGMAQVCFFIGFSSLSRLFPQFYFTDLSTVDEV